MRARLAADGEWLDLCPEEWRVLFWLEIVAQGARSDALKAAAGAYFESARACLTGEIEDGSRESGNKLQLPPSDLAHIVLATQIGLFVQGLFAEEPAGRDLLDALAGLVSGETQTGG